MPTLEMRTGLARVDLPTEEFYRHLRLDDEGNPQTPSGQFFEAKKRGEIYFSNSIIGQEVKSHTTVAPEGLLRAIFPQDTLKTGYIQIDIDGGTYLSIPMKTEVLKRNKGEIVEFGNCEQTPNEEDNFRRTIYGPGKVMGEIFDLSSIPHAA